FNAMPDHERDRLIAARSTGRHTTKIYESKVDQAAHQAEPERGEIIEIRQKIHGSKYLIRVFVANTPKGRLREYPVDSPLLKAA
ncbi:MAG: hypothetical protein V3U84_11040, partial [Thiotrichaceae bacterium]